MTALDEELLDQYHRALSALINGNPDVYKSMFSQREDVTLANPSALSRVDGPRSRRDWSGPRRITRRRRLTGFEQIAKYETPELAYLVEVERVRAKVGGREELAPVALGSRASSGPRARPGRSSIDTRIR